MITKTNKAFPKERLYFNFSEFSQVQPSQKLNAVSGHKKISLFREIFGALENWEEKNNLR